MHSFEVHSNESVSRKSGRLGMEQVYLVLDKNAYDNAYSTPLRHEVWDMDHKKSIQQIETVIYSVLFDHRLVPSQDVHFFYTRSHLSALQNCALPLSTNF